MKPLSSCAYLFFTQFSQINSFRNDYGRDPSHEFVLFTTLRRLFSSSYASSSSASEQQQQGKKENMLNRCCRHHFCQNQLSAWNVWLNTHASAASAPKIITIPAFWSFQFNADDHWIRFVFAKILLSCCLCFKIQRNTKKANELNQMNARNWVTSTSFNSPRMWFSVHTYRAVTDTERQRRT